MKPTTLTELKTAWLACKQAETSANTQRLEIEAQMLALLPKQDEGTVTDDDSGISVTYKMTRSVDSNALSRDWQKLPPAVQASFKWTASLNTSAWRAAMAGDEFAASCLPNYITRKPAKPAITIKEN